MPEGQFTGEKATFEYVSDDAIVYLLTLDKSNGELAEVNLTPALVGTTGIPAPKRFTPRYVNWVGELDGKQRTKRLVCNNTASAYSNVSTAITVDGVPGITTGRVGEKFTYNKLPIA